MEINNFAQLSSIYLNKELSDVKFLLENTENEWIDIPAHRLIMSAYSPVFNRMFFGEFKDDGSVKVLGATAEGFFEFLQLFYLSKVKLTNENIQEVLILIDRYDASQFWTTCESFMVANSNEETALMYYELALMFKLNTVKKMAEKVLRDNRQSVLGAEDVDEEVVKNILISDNLQGNEIDIFNDVMAWAYERCSNSDIQMTLLNVMPYIRFPLMRTEEVLEIITKYPFLIPIRQAVEVMQYIEFGQELPRDNKFSVVRRIPNFDDIFISSQTKVHVGSARGGSFAFKWQANFSTKLLVSMTVKLPTVISDDVTVFVNQRGTRVEEQLSPLLFNQPGNIDVPFPIEVHPGDNVRIGIELKHKVDGTRWFANPLCNSPYVAVEVQPHICLNFISTIRMQNA